MAHLIVGTDDCKTIHVVEILANDEQLYKKWANVARSLEVPWPTILKAEQQLLLGLSTHYVAYYDCLVDWRSFKVDDATLGVLISVLNKFQLTTVAEKLMVKFNVRVEDLEACTPPASKLIQWANLSKKAEEERRIHNANSSRLHNTHRLLFDLQDPTPLFVGREEELEQVHKLLGQNGRFAVITHIMSVSGLGGVGKTQLAMKYAQVFKNHYDNNVLWVNAESEESMTSSFYKLASNKLQISTTNADNKEKEISIVVQECYEYFQSIKCLYIFDNVEKEDYLKKFLPRKDASDKIYVLMTSRHQDWGRSAQVIGLDVFSEEDAITFVKHGLEIEGGITNEEIKLLVRRLQYFPLAISQAISYIYNEQRMDEFSIKDYLDEFESSPSHLLDCDMSDEFENNYTQTTFTTWKMTIDKIAQTPKCGHLAVKILNLMSYFSSNDIHRDSFFELDECTHRLVKQACNLLVKYSMVMTKENQSIFSIHRLVQEVVRIDLRRTGKESEAIDMALQLAGECIISENFIVHAISVWNYAKGRPEIVCKYVELAKNIMIKLREVGKYIEACNFGVNNLDNVKIFHLGNSLSILEFQKSLGVGFREAGDYNTSLYHLENVQKECKALGINDDFLLDIQEHIAWVFGCQRRYSEALNLGLIICRRSKLIFGEGHLSTASSLFSTAHFAHEMDKLDLSHKIFLDGFRCYHLANDVEEVIFLNARHNFSLLLADRGNYAYALEILNEIHDRITANPALKVSFHFRMSTLGHIGKFLNLTNKHVDAYKILDELYEKRKCVLGDDHQDTLITLIYLSQSLCGMKRYEEAFVACNTAHLKLKKESFWALEALKMLAAVLSYQGQHSTAIECIKTVITTRERRMELKSRDVLHSKYSYTLILARANKYEEALVILEELKETYLQDFGERTLDYLRCVAFIKKIQSGGKELRDWLRV